MSLSLLLAGVLVRFLLGYPLSARPFAERLAILACDVAGGMALLRAARDVHGERAAWRAASAWLALPVVTIGLLDRPASALLFALAAGSVWALARAAERPSPLAWATLGAALGAVAAWRPVGVALVVGVAAAAGRRSTFRRGVADGWPWLVGALLVAGAVTSVLGGWPARAAALVASVPAPLAGARLAAQVLAWQAVLVSPVALALLLRAAWDAARQGGRPARAVAGASGMVAAVAASAVAAGGLVDGVGFGVAWLPAVLPLATSALVERRPIAWRLALAVAVAFTAAIVGIRARG